MAIFYNQATLTYNGNTTNSNITTGELVEVLSATKTAVTDNYVANDDITYVVNIVNSGTVPFSDLTVTDNLGAYTFNTSTLVPLTYVENSIHYYVNGVLQPTPTTTVGTALVVSGINIPAGGNATIIYEVRANQYAPLASGSTITNTVVISSESLNNPVTAVETVTAENTAQLTISKSVSPSTVTENGQLTYTFIIQNSGNTPADAADNVTVTDLFNPILDPISVSFNGTAWTAGTNYTYNTATGAFATIPGQITVPAATYTQNPETGTWTVNPGVSVLTVIGTV
ncbi:MAG: DUF11 domain-containing protein [Oscillospiraceae bacterium]|nr:DUF11 domain-containing protein [Oscillospiraceae bacterium]